MKQFSEQEFTVDLLNTVSLLADLPVSEIALTDDLREDIGLDSLQSMELLSRISERWEVDVEMEDMMDVKTVRDVVTFMARLAKEQSR